VPNTLKEVWAVRNWLATNASLREESKREREREREREERNYMQDDDAGVVQDCNAILDAG
jgi:hypothetical protein